MNKELSTLELVILNTRVNTRYGHAESINEKYNHIEDIEIDINVIDGEITTDIVLRDNEGNQYDGYDIEELEDIEANAFLSYLIHYHKSSSWGWLSQPFLESTVYDMNEY